MSLRSLLFFLSIICLISNSCSQTSPKHKSNPSSKDYSNLFRIGSYSPTLDFESGIRCIFEDSKGNVWFGSHQQGACMYDGKTFTYYKEKDGLNDNQVRSIEEDSDGNIWFSTAIGVCVLKNEELECHGKEDFADKFILPAQLVPVKENDLIFGGGNFPTFFRYDGNDVSHIPLPVPSNTSEGGPYWVTGIASGKNGRRYIATYAGVFIFENGKVSLVNDKSLGYTKAGNLLHVRSIFEIVQGNYGLAIMV